MVTGRGKRKATGEIGPGGCCDMRGMLSFLILFMLSKRNMHGQEIATEIEHRKGVRPSPGTIYPALKGLREDGFITEKKAGKTVTYALTAEGKRALRMATKQFCKTFSDIFLVFA